MKIADKFISITDMRKNASQYIGSLSTTGEKWIFVNNKPRAVLMDIAAYERLLGNDDLVFETLEWSDEMLQTKEHRDFISLLRNA